MNNKNLEEQFLGFYNTPSLFNENIYGIENFEFDKIELNAIDFTSLQITEKIPLGKRIERFFEFYIMNSNRYDMILNNIQIIENKNTLGEIDFILFDKKKNEFIHLELVYKFYIYDNRFPKELDKYVGPNRNDTLIKKLTKLKEKQFPLLFRKETTDYLKNIDIDNIKQKLCFKANLFYFENDFNNSFELINNQCKKGLYIKYQDFIRNDVFKEYKYYMPHRFDWVSTFDIADLWVDYAEIFKMVEVYYSMKKSPLLWMKNSNSSNWLFVTFS